MLLIFALTLALALGVSVWASVADFLGDCDDFYTTIGLVEYMGISYPDDTAYDPAMDEALQSFDSATITNDGATLFWETPSRAFGYIEGFWRTDTFMPDRMLSILVVGNVAYSEENDIYNAIVFDSLYSTSIKDNQYIFIEKDFGTFEPNRYYLIFGEAYRGYSPILHIRAAAYNNAITKSKGVNIPRMIDITSDGFDEQHFTIPEESILLKIAQTLGVTNNSVLVSATNNLLALQDFHQEELFFVDGRTFKQEEYQNGSKVAVISDLMAARLGIGVGDTFKLSVAVSDYPGVYNSYWVEDGFSYEETFTVVGLTNTVMDKSWYVYVPQSVEVPTSPFPIGYTVGYAIIENEDAPGFFTRMESKIHGRFNLRIYDQGYASVALPYQNILLTAIIVTVVCAFVQLAVLTLFGFLFIYRQRETSETMLMLGAGKQRVCGYFLFSAGAIALIATASGALTAYWLHDQIILLVSRAADNFALIDSRFSNGNLTITRTLSFAPDLDWQLFLIIGTIVFVLAILACLGFMLAAFNRSKPGQKKQRGPSPSSKGKTSTLPGGSIKYALLSILRGGERSLVVPKLALTIVIFLGQLTTTNRRYQDQLEAIYDNTTIEGYFTDIKGKQIGNLVLNAYDIRNLYHTDYLSALAVTMDIPYMYLGISQFADGQMTDLSPLYVPSNSYRRESLEETIRRGPNLTAANNIRKSPEFYYADDVEMTFLEDVDETFLAVPSTHPQVLSCIVPTSFMAEHGISLGDSIRVATDKIITNQDGDRIYLHMDLRVVGSYEKQGFEDTIYTPLAILFYDTKLIWGEGQPASGPIHPDADFTQDLDLEQTERFLKSAVFHSTIFSLKDSHELIDFKDYLDNYGYSQVNHIGKIREFIILKDAAFNNAVASIAQQNRYIKLLYPFLYALVAIISITVSYLLVASRKAEFATMRGLGAKRSRAFFSFFYEQSILCLLGTGIGIIIWQLICGQPASLHLKLIAGFLTSYFLGSAISMMIMNQTKVLQILLDRD